MESSRTLCRTTVNLADVGKRGTLVWVDLEDLERHTDWIARGILVVEPDPSAPPAEDAYIVEEPELAEAPPVGVGAAGSTFPVPPLAAE